MYASVCYGGFVFDDTRIDLYEVFYKDAPFSQDLYKVVDECSSPIGDIREFLDDREMDYELTTYGRNAVLIYKKEQ